MLAIQVSKKDLISLVRGIEPSYKQMKNEGVDYCGSYSASYDRWTWNTSKLNEYSEKELYNLYIFLRDGNIK